MVDKLGMHPKSVGEIVYLMNEDYKDDWTLAIYTVEELNDIVSDMIF